MTFTESLTAHFPDAIPANQFVSGSQRALARIGVHRGGALPMIVQPAGTSSPSRSPRSCSAPGAGRSTWPAWPVCSHWAVRG